MGEQVGARIHCKKQLRLLSIYKAKLWILELPVIRNIKGLMFLMADKNQSKASHVSFLKNRSECE